MKITRDEWTAALRSGDFEQGKRRLRTPGEYTATGNEQFCCLGVACRVSGMPYDTTIRSASSDITAVTGGAEAVYESWKPDHVNRVYLPTDIGFMLDITPSDERELATMNDGGKTFAQIADYIDKLPTASQRRDAGK